MRSCCLRGATAGWQRSAVRGTPSTMPTCGKYGLCHLGERRNKIAEYHSPKWSDRNRFCGDMQSDLIRGCGEVIWVAVWVWRLVGVCWNAHDNLKRFIFTTCLMFWWEHGGFVGLSRNLVFSIATCWRCRCLIVLVMFSKISQQKSQLLSNAGHWCTRTQWSLFGSWAQCLRLTVVCFSSGPGWWQSGRPSVLFRKHFSDSFRLTHPTIIYFLCSCFAIDSDQRISSVRMIIEFPIYPIFIHVFEEINGGFAFRDDANQEWLMITWYNVRIAPNYIWNFIDI